MAISGSQIDDISGSQGLRGRKKAKRRDEILFHAKTLFAENGIDATTMAGIADAAQVSPPTVFNYFGNKDGILIALITEGAQKAIAADVAMTPRDDSDFGTILVEMLNSVSVGTLNIASKRVWRYAEASCIRHPDTELAQKFNQVDGNLRRALAEYLQHYDFSMRSQEPADSEFLAELIFDIWNATFFELIKNGHIDMDQHSKRLSERIRPLVRMLFDDAFLEKPVLKQCGN